MRENGLLSPPQASERLAVSLRTLANWRSRRIKLRFVKVGARVYYREQDVEDFRNRFHHEIEVGDE